MISSSQAQILIAYMNTSVDPKPTIEFHQTYLGTARTNTNSSSLFLEGAKSKQSEECVDRI